jgi:phosphate uptake regulator
VPISPSPEEVARLALEALQTGCAAFVRRDAWLALEATEASAYAARAEQATQTALVEADLPGSGSRRARLLLVARCVERIAANATSISDRARTVLGLPDAEAPG